jgi:hypothetical protein
VNGRSQEGHSHDQVMHQEKPNFEIGPSWTQFGRNWVELDRVGQICRAVAYCEVPLFYWTKLDPAGHNWTKFLAGLTWACSFLCISQGKPFEEVG